jgi:hypothetical protein
MVDEHRGVHAKGVSDPLKRGEVNGRARPRFDLTYGRGPNPSYFRQLRL